MKSNIKAIFPKIKKKISAFLTSEEGKISKQSLLITGSLLGVAALAPAAVVAEETADCFAADGSVVDVSSSPGCGVNTVCHYNEVALGDVTKTSEEGALPAYQSTAKHNHCSEWIHASY